MSTVWNNITSEPASYASVESNTSSNIVRLVEDPEVKKGIQFDELSIEHAGIEKSGGAPVEQTTLVGALYPIIRINDMEFGIKNISRMLISSDSFLPTISLTLKLENSDFVVKNMPKDGDIISTFIRSNTDALNFLRNDFIITSCETSSAKGKHGTTIHLTGTMFIPGIDSDYNLFGIIGSSRTVCKEVAKMFKIGFAFNDEEDTDDFQNWICSGRPDNFIEEVTSHAWKNSESFYNSWIDLYYNLCFVNVNKFLVSEGREDVDITFASNVSAYQGLTRGEGEKPEDAKVMVKMLSNSNSFRGTPFFVTSWSITNNSGLSIKRGYVEESYVYIHNQHLYTADSSACFSILNNISTYDKDKLDSYMILRGRTTYDPNKNTNEKSRVNYDMQNIYITRNYAGVEYTLSDDTDTSSTSNNEWAGNVHKNYLRSPMHNEMNLVELEKMYITVETDGLCLQIMRGERVPIVLEQDIASNTGMLDEANITTTGAIHKMYSGYYIVDSIEYGYNPKRMNSNISRSPFYTSMVLKRREWPTPEEVKKG
jgi:hypothetical protein